MSLGLWLRPGFVRSRLFVLATALPTAAEFSVGWSLVEPAPGPAAYVGRERTSRCLVVRTLVFAVPERLHGVRHHGAGAGQGADEDRVRVGLCSGRPAVRRALIRLRSRSSTRPTAAASIPSGTWPGSPASCRRTPMPGSTGSTRPSASRGRSSRPPAGHTRDANCSSSPRSARRRSRPRRCGGSMSCSRSSASINGKPAEERLAVREERAKPLVTRARGLAARPARAGLAQVGDRQGDRLRPEPLAGAHPVPWRMGGSA